MVSPVVAASLPTAIDEIGVLAGESGGIAVVDESAIGQTHEPAGETAGQLGLMKVDHEGHVAPPGDAVDEQL